MSHQIADKAERITGTADVPANRASGRKSRAKPRQRGSQICASSRADGEVNDGILLQRESPAGLARAGVLELPRILDIKAAAPLMAEFLARRGGPLAVDASRVVRVGGLCLQVLLSAAISWRIDRKPLEFINPSAGFSSGLALLGIAFADLSGWEKSP